MLVLFRCGEANRSGDDCHWKRLCYSPFLRRGGMARWAQPHKEAPAWPRRQQEQGKSMSKSLYGGFFTGKNRQGRASCWAGPGWDTPIHFGRLWAGQVFCPVPGPRVISGRGIISHGDNIPGCRILTERGAWEFGLRICRFAYQAGLAGKPFATSRNELTPGEAICLPVHRRQDFKAP